MIGEGEPLGQRRVCPPGAMNSRVPTRLTGVCTRVSIAKPIKGAMGLHSGEERGRCYKQRVPGESTGVSWLLSLNWRTPVAELRAPVRSDDDIFGFDVLARKRPKGSIGFRMPSQAKTKQPTESTHTLRSAIKRSESLLERDRRGGARAESL